MFHQDLLIRYAGPFCCPSCSKAVSGRGQRSARICPLSGLPLVNITVIFWCSDCQCKQVATKTFATGHFIQLIARCVNEAEAPVPSQSGPAERQQTSPSVRPDTPADPIGDADVQHAKRLLRRTSFRRDTKSWAAFLRRLNRP